VTYQPVEEKSDHNDNKVWVLLDSKHPVYVTHKVKRTVNGLPYDSYEKIEFNTEEAAQAWLDKHNESK